MRVLYTALICAGLYGAMAARPAAALAAPHAVVALQTAAAAQDAAPPKDVNVDINVNRGGGGGVWYRNPVWLAVGAVAVVVLALLIALVARGGGTTIVRE